MKALQQLFSGFYELFSFDEATSIRQRNEAYLAESTDLHDLEHRIRVLDRKSV